MLGNRAGEETGTSQYWEITPTATAVFPKVRKPFR